MGKESKSFFEKVEGEILQGAQNYVKEKVTKKIIKIGEFSVMVFMAFILICFGVAYLIGHYFPLLDNGLNFILLGVIFLIVGFIIKM